MPCRIVVCDDNKNVRTFLQWIIKRRPGMEIVGEGSTGREAVSLCRTLNPDLLLVDVQMEGECDGIDAIAEIRPGNREVKIIVLTVYSDDDFVVHAFQNGADNFILKDLSQEEILKTIDDTLSGEVHLSQMVANKLKNFVAHIGAENKRQDENYRKSMKILSMLTKTELEILWMLREGCTREVISRKKVVEPGTVKTHVSNILKKLERRKTSILIQDLERLGFFDYLDPDGLSGQNP